jgi:hypothetical protein
MACVKSCSEKLQSVIFDSGQDASIQGIGYEKTRVCRRKSHSRSRNRTA